MLERLHEHGFDDLDAAHLTVLQYPGPQGLRPSELAARLGMSKQAVNYLLGRARAPRLPRAPSRTRTTCAPSGSSLTERGYAAIPVIRGAVAEIEEAWSRELGAERFVQLRERLVELNERL